ncbi:MAG: methylated-DNA--[protein]-cysteine S-methyltransferase [Pseudomonadota bacterium]
MIDALLSALNEQPDRRWRESDISDLGFDPSTARRVFKKHFDITFLEMARQRRLRRGFETLAKGGNVIDGQLDAGFDSPSAFRVAFSKLLGRAPSDWASDATVFVDWIATPLGNMISATCRSKLHLLEFMDRRALPGELRRLEKFAGGRLGIASTDISGQIKEELAVFFKGKRATFETPLAYHGSEFTRSVWQLLQDIPPGETRTYGEIAETLGRPTASRAVARANGANQIALVIPCHRVIGADGSLTGYGGGLWRKHKLLEIEQHYASTR